MKKAVTPPTAKKNLKEIKHKNKALTLFNIANLALMVNTGTTGIIRAIESYAAKEHVSLTWTQVGTEFSTLLVTTLFVFLAIAANNVDKSKKHHEFILAAEKMQRKAEIDQQHEKSIRRTSQTVTNIDRSLTIFTSLMAILFFVCGVVSILARADGSSVDAARYDFVGYTAYIFAVLLTLMNKVICDKLQMRLGKRYVKKNPQGEQEVKLTFMNKLTESFYRLFKKNSVSANHLPIGKTSGSD